MKSLSIALLMIGVLVLLVLAFPTRSYAQDTLDVPSILNGDPVGALNITLANDTLANGAPGHKVYRLARGEVYYSSGTMLIHGPIEVMANAEPANVKPPVIAPAILQDGSIPAGPLFRFYKDATVKNLYMTRIRPDTVGAGFDYSNCIQISGDSTRIVVDNCVIDGFGSGGIFKGAIFNKIYITNCLFRNMFNGGGSWFGGWAFESGATPGDTVVMVNNTMFNCGSYLSVPNRNITTYVRLEHNTVFTNHVNPLYAPYLSNAVVRDNIFFGTLAMGQTQTEITGGWFDWKGAPSSTVSLDTLPTTLGFAEANRKVIVNHNVYFWPQAYYDQWTNVFKDTLTPPVWMNARTLGMFGDKTTWPLLDDGDNATNLDKDPGFGATEMGIIDPLLAYCRHNRGDASAPATQFFNPPGGDLFDVSWPVPENLAYTDAALQTGGHDGYAVGDLNWFPTQKAAWLAAGLDAVPNQGNTVPTDYSLSQNYPNPFNPTTAIQYTVPKSGTVLLKVYNSLGQEVATLVNGAVTAGQHSVTFDAHNLASGVYFYRLVAGTYSATMKMMLLK
jgi:hypothetical protein